ncbi:MAG: GAF domain-containing protein [Candidatus Rokubacteria bacterium]|nr:GAF domain-containing protein [Candidatus Rokubacteria bacterium]
MSAELAATLDVAQVTDRIATAVLEIFGVKRSAVYRLDRDSGELACVAEAPRQGAGRLPWLGQRLPPGSGVSGRAVAERRVVTSPDQLADPGLRFPEWALERMRQERYRSGTAVPLMVRDEVLGTLFLGDAAGRLLPDDGLGLLSAFADQAAVVIHAAQLRERLGQRLERLQALARIDELLLSSLDSDEILAEIARAAALLMPAAHVRVWIPEEASQTLVARAVAGELAEEGFPVRRLRFGEGVTGWVAEHRRPLEIPDFSADERVVEPGWFRARGLTSAIIFPVVHAESLLGVLSLIGRAPFRLDPDDRSLLQSFVAQSALALRNARLFEESERHRREAEVLAKLVADINASRDLDGILTRVGEGARELCGSDLAGVALREPGSGAVMFRHWAGARLDLGRVRVEPGKGVGGMVLATGHPFRTDCYAEDSRISQDYRELVVAEGVVAAMAVPVEREGQVEALLYVHNRSPRPFTDQDEAILVRLADHAARALGNARLTGALRTRQGHLEALLEVSRELSRIQPVEALLGRIAELCGRLLESTSVGIRLVEGDDLVVSEGWGDARQVMVTPRLKVGQSLSGVVAASGEPLLVEDIGSDPRVEPAHREAARRLGYTRWLGVPLKVGERVLGVLNVRRGGSRPFTGEELEIATAFASQATAALENARLYREAQEAYARLAQTQAELAQSQKMEAVGRLAGGIAHDFNNLLTVVIGRSELALARLSGDDPLRRDLGLIGTTSKRAAALVRQLLAFSRKQVLRPEVLDLAAVVAGLQGMLRRLIGEDIDLLAVIAPGLGRVTADPGQLEQVIVNLVVNARDAMPRGGRITIETANVDLHEAVAAEREGLPPGAYVRLAVRDTGHGMDAETQAHIFEPFFTTKEVGKGTGLGLATVYGIVKQSDGAIRVASEPGVGTTFTILLPRVREEAQPAPAPAAPGTLPRGTETILLVEDDPELRALGLEVLQAVGYTVLEACEGHEALLVLERHRGPIHLLVTDVVMPRMGGLALAERLAVLRPELRVLFMSGYSEAAIAQHGVLDPGTAFMPKPFTPEGLTRKVREVLDAP